MTQFLLSPGITPQLTDLFVLEFPIAVGFAYFLKGSKGVELVIGLNALVLAVIKIVTDYSDPYDDLVSVAVLAGGLGVLYPLLVSGAPHLSFGVGVTLGAVVGALGLFKAAGDFYDPFDLLMADMGVVAGLWLGRPLLERWFPSLKGSSVGPGKSRDRPN